MTHTQNLEIQSNVTMHADLTTWLNKGVQAEESCIFEVAYMYTLLSVELLHEDFVHQARVSCALGLLHALPAASHTHVHQPTDWCKANAEQRQNHRLQAVIMIHEAAAGDEKCIRKAHKPVVNTCHQAHSLAGTSPDRNMGMP